MKTGIFSTFVALLCLVGFEVAGLKAQQLRVSNIYIFNPQIMNPASVGGGPLNNVNMSYQQRKLAVKGWRSLSQFLNYSSQPLGKSQRFGWGVNLNSDFEWTEFRIGLSASVAASLIKTEKQRLSVGIMGGIINWGSNYKNVRVYDRTEDILDGRGNFIDLDVGMGFGYALHTKLVRLDLNAYGMQLPGNLISKGIQGLKLYPHLFVGGGVLFSPVHNIFIGPRFFYKDIFLRDGTKIGGGALDVGLRLDLDRQKMWFGGTVRPAKKAGLLNLAFGLRIKETDTIGDPTRYGYFVDLNAGFGFPMGLTSAFGPTAEIGIALAMGRQNRRAYRMDTVRVSPGPFWQDEGNLNDHLIAKLKPNGPQGLRGQTKVKSNGVELVYTFDDNSFQYVGNTPQKEDTLFSELGPEWIGVDAILENIVASVIHDGLSPDTNGVINPEILEPLKDLVSIELSTTLSVDEIEANMDAKGMMYEGEMGTNNKFKDSLLLKVVYNEKDTIVGIGRDQNVTNLQLAALKLHAMRMKLEYELLQKYGEVWAVLWDGEEPTVEKTAAKKIVYLKTPRITPNNPNQPAYQVNSIKLRFTRGNTVVANTGTDKPGRINRRHNRRTPAGARIRDRVY
jgi:Type IX secretion system membrane protein PorP/SprF